MNPLFCELLQVALGKKGPLSRLPSPEDWNLLYEISLKQAVAGMTFLALDKISLYEQKPQLPLLYEWIGLSEQIKQRNLILNKRCVEITQHFEDAGFRCCVLKGQGNAQMYPEPLSRTSGDVDIWLDGNKDNILSFIKKRFPDAIDSGMHLSYPIFNDVEVEVHYKPQYLSFHKYDKRIQRFFSSKADAQFEHKIRLDGTSRNICVPCHEFNLILQLAHMLGHFYGEGIGLRHFIDLFYLLKQMDREKSTKDTHELLYRLGMGRFTRGVMWVEKEILGVSENHLVIEPSEKIGRIILSEIEKGGNFGKYNIENERRLKGVLTRSIIDSLRLLQLSRVQPTEAFVRFGNKMVNFKSMKEVVRFP